MASDALNWNVAPSNLERFHKPAQPVQTNTYGFQGYPEGNMIQPKQPLRQQASADATREVNRYFRKDSPSERFPSPPPQAQSHREQEPDWLKPKSPPQPQQSTLSPRYADESPRKVPVIRDPMHDMTEAERNRKIEEHYIAEEDRAEAARRRREAAEAKKDEQRKVRQMQANYQPYGLPGGGAPSGDNRKMRFTEHQLERNVDTLSPRYPPPDTPSRPAREHDLKVDRVQQNPEVMRSMDFDTRGKQDTAQVQESQIADLQNEIEKLKSQGYPEIRAQSDSRGSAYAPSEPQTDRGQRRQRDREIWGHHRMSQSPADYLGVTPRRNPVGSFFGRDTTYKSDFDEPTVRHGNRNLGNPNKAKHVPFHPFGGPGGGAPISDMAGKMQPRNKGTMDCLGREHSESARARRTHKTQLRQTIQEQIAFEKYRKDMEKEYARQPFRPYANQVRDTSVGYARYREDGTIDNHHLKHSMSNAHKPEPLHKQREYHSFLQNQIDERDKITRLSKLDEKRQAKLHFQNFDDFFGRYGGGNVKGNDTRKVNLDRAINAPQDTTPYYNKVRLANDGLPEDILDRFKPRITVNSTHTNLYEYPQGRLKMNYRGGAPYAEFMTP